MHNSHRFLVLATLSALLGSGAAQAQNHTLKLGAVRYDTHAKTSGISGVGIPPGADATIGDATTALLTYEYALSPQVGLELVIGVPPKIKATASGSVAFLGEVLTARNVAPTLFLSYHFGSAGDTFRPYLGFGVNYTKFTDVKTPYGWDVSLSDSVGLAAHVGADWRLGRQWGLWASLGAVDVRSRLVATGATVLQTQIDFRPLTYSAGAFFRF